MKKVILAVDGTQFSTAAFDFIEQLNVKEPLLVAGIFVPQLDYASLWSYAAAAGSNAVYVPLLEDEDSEDVRKNIAAFEQQCQRASIPYRVHKDFYDFALPELKRETRFADVMVLSGELFYKQVAGANQFEYMRTALHQSECPVLIVPEDYRFPTRNILAYDGSEESVYAIKQFAYIFPQLADNETTLVWAEPDEAKDFPDKALIQELAAQHYRQLSFYKSDINPKKFFSTWVGEQKDAVLVSGSFGRSGFSESIRRSFVADVIKDHQVPVFIAHK
jgi:hypothetical protein